jgi:hypothetical protein
LNVWFAHPGMISFVRQCGAPPHEQSGILLTAPRPRKKEGQFTQSKLRIYEGNKH